MKKIIIPLLLLLATVDCYSQDNKEKQLLISTKQDQKEMNATVTKSAIEDLLSSYSEALNNSDVLKTVALYVNQGIIMPNGAPLSKGGEQLRITYEGLFKAFELNVKYNIDEIIISGDYAFARTHSKGTGLIRANAQTIPIDNKELFVLQKENGQWKISHYIFNNNMK